MSVSSVKNSEGLRAAISVLKTVDLHKSYGQDRVLDGVNLELSAGERVAIMGPSGSGKSTLLHCLSGILPVDSGQIFLGDREVSSLSEDEWAVLRSRSMAFIFQFFQLLPTLTVQENVEFPLLLQQQPKDSRQERVAELLKEVDLEHRRMAFPETLSGGEQQRVAIARALAASPKLLFADEPTGSLDARNGQAILDLLQALSERTQTAILMATHDRQAASRCDRVFRLVEGQLIEDASV
ncbi:MAG: ABC transporter ATP-binding protein [Opitutales bacterium]|nr:ABC transporter ATP-binding protein [Opitutales bacterium]